MQGCTTTVTSEVKSESSHGVHTFRKLYTFHCGVLDHHKNWPDMQESWCWISQDSYDVMDRMRLLQTGIRTAVCLCKTDVSNDLYYSTNIVTES